MSAVDNEVHFVLCCPSFDDLRYEFIEPKYFNNPCEFRMALLLATQNERALKKHSTKEKPCYLFCVCSDCKRLFRVCMLRL